MGRLLFELRGERQKEQAKVSLGAILAIVAISTPVQVLACECIDIPVELEKRSALVFIGRAVVLEPFKDTRLHGTESVVWEVFQSWNRHAPRVVRTRGGGGVGGCDYSVEKGRIYLIFARKSYHDESLSLSMCSHNRRYECAQAVLERLGRIRTSFEPIPADALLAKSTAPCACTAPLDALAAERRHSDAVFVGRAVDVQPTEYRGAIRVTWEVIQAWNKNTPRRVTVVLPSDEQAGCGWPLDPHPRSIRPVVGRVALIFARTSRTRELYVPACTNSTPLICIEKLPQDLGPPIVTYEPLPAEGTNERPLDCLLNCVKTTDAVGGLYNRVNEILPRGAWLQDVSFVEWTDGTIHDFQFSLRCRPWAAQACTPALETQAQRSINGYIVPLMMAAGRPVAAQMHLTKLGWFAP